MKLRQWTLFLGFVLAALICYWLVQTASAPSMRTTKSAPERDARSRRLASDDPLPKFRGTERSPASNHGDSAAEAAGAIGGQRVLLFKDQDALNRFLARVGDRLKFLGRLDALHALRVGFADYADLLAALEGDEEEAFVFPVSTPTPPEGSAQPGAAQLGNRLHDWLGITEDNSNWGRGVKIAVLDTGITSHATLQGSIRAINLVELPADRSTQNGHGTAVASVMAGNEALTPGVAPGAELLSVRVADDAGQSNSFLLAQGIVAAVDAGARLINISMGSPGDSAVVRDAIAYARDHGAMIFAAAGNNGTAQVSYPAANDGVVAVGAVDARGDHMAFSNSGEAVAISAPGYGLNAAWTGDEAVSVSGTSFSAPIIAGAVAAIMTEAGDGTLTPAQAYKLLVATLNDGGAAGADPELGAGMPDLGRVFQSGQRGIYDAAVASHRILSPNAANPYGQVEILVQNRGTETLINTAVVVNNSTSGSQTVNLTALAPNAVQTVRVPIAQPPATSGGRFQVDSRVVLSGGLRDAKPSNDRRAETYVATGRK